MKILQINAVGQSGSTGRNCAEVAAYINQKTEHYCYTAFSEGETDEYAFQIGMPSEKKVHALLSRLSGKQAHFSKKGTKKLLRRIGELKPDLVHLHNLHGNYIHFPMLLRYLAKSNIPTAVTLHDCWFYTGKCCHYTVDGCSKWQTGCGNCPRLKKDNPSWFVDATRSLWSEKKTLFEALPRLGVIGVSDWIKNEAKQSLLSTAKEITRIYNWIDLDIFSPREDTEELRRNLGAERKKIVLGVASGWNEAKGLYQFMELAHLLGEEYRVVLVGNLTTDMELPENVTHVPATESTDELAMYYSAADVFVSLSPEESFGKVSAEALACGTPIVCYDSTANGELVGDGCGRIIRPNEIAGAAQAVRELCEAGKSAFSERCRVYAQANFSKEDRIRDYLEFYQRLLSDQK